MKEKILFRWNISGPLLSGALAAVILSGQIFIPLNQDNSTFQAMTLALLRYGRLPYLGSWDQNFPGNMGIHALGILLFGNSDLGFGLVNVILNTVTAILFYQVTRFWFSHRVSLLTSLLYALFYVHSGEMVNGQRDVFVTLFLLLSFYLLLKAALRPAGFLLIFFAGLSAGYCVFIRPTYALVFGVLMTVVGIQSRKWRTTLIFLIAGLLPFLIFIVPYLLHPSGLIEVFNSVIRFNLEVYGPYPPPKTEPFLAIIKHALLFSMAVVGLVMLRIQSKRRADTIGTVPKHGTTIYFSILAALFLSPIVMGKYGDYRFFPFFSLLIPLGGIGCIGVYARFQELLSRRGTLSRVAPVIGVSFLVLLTVRIMDRDPFRPFVQALGSPNPYDSAQTTYIVWRHSYIPGCDVRIEKKVVRYLAPRVGRNESIECCTLWPGLNWRLNRRSATRFTTLLPLCLKDVKGQFTVYQRDWRREYVDSLSHSPPSYIILTDAKLSDMAYVDDIPINLVKSIPGFTALLEEKYQLDTVIDIYSLYRRK